MGHNYGALAGVKAFLVVVLGLTACGFATGQNVDPVELDRDFCVAEEMHVKRMENDPVYRKGFLEHTRQLNVLLDRQVHHRSSQVMQYTVPVVVHIIHLGEAEGEGSNITDDRVFAAIDGLNDRFANTVGMGLDIEIDFCLASRAPDGCATNGIIRVDGSEIPNYVEEGIEYNNCGADEQDIKDLSRWPTSQYYNIWVVHDICGNFAGYAYYPNGGPYDGTVIVDNAMTYNSRTLSHELGHGLNLRHTFNGDNDGNDCPPNENCMTQGDLICDTPPHKRGDCGTSNPCMGGGTWENSRYNYMSYCGTPLALGRFTSDQKDRMRAAMESFPRSALLQSEGCDAPIQGEILSSGEPMCPEEQRTLEGYPDDGEFNIVSGPGDISGNTLTALAEGTIIIEFVSCAGILEQEITVYGMPEPDITSDNGPMCVEEERILTGLPGGGEFMIESGPGILDGDFLIATGSGVIDLVYSVNENGCTGETYMSIDVFDVPEAFFENDDSGMCVGDTRILFAQPPGGDFEVVAGAGSLNGDVLTADGAGVIEVRYTVIENGCTGEALYSVEADSIPDVNILTESDTICFDEMIELTADPDGGLFTIVSGPAIIDSGFITMTQFGTAVVAYSFGQNGCSAGDTITMSFIEAELPQMMSVDSSLCVGDTTIIFLSPDGGQLSALQGSAVVFDNMVVATAPGNIVLRYSTCAGADTQQVSANAVPDPMITSSDAALCSGSSRQLETSIPGGEFVVLSGPGAINGSTLEATGVGEIMIGYEVSVNGCSGFDTQSVHVDELAEVLITLQEEVLTANIKNGEFQWVDCENQYEPLPGETQQSFIVTTSGQYALVSVQGACRDTSDCVEVILTGLEDPFDLNDIQILPNPSTGMFSVVMDGNQEEVRVTVRNMLGSLLTMTATSAESLSFNLAVVPSGVYLVTIDRANKSVVKKLMIE